MSVKGASNVIALPGLEDGPILVEPGEHLAVYMRHERPQAFKGLKLRVIFRLQDQRPVQLSRWYQVATSKGPIAAPACSDLVREMQAVLGRRVRHDRIPISALAGILVRVDVRTVTSDYRQRTLALINQYSVIGRLEGKA
ncbi:MAG TPA: hypothetical protein VHY75_02960 [Steroidobacteraceae bacterium]|jgi:hypothetical protein|nr:hypothetical protein [Steroidobacteraceae bacterium]